MKQVGFQIPFIVLCKEPCEQEEVVMGSSCPGCLTIEIPSRSHYRSETFGKGSNKGRGGEEDDDDGRGIVMGSGIDVSHGN